MGNSFSNCVVSSRWNNLGWTWNWIRPIRYSREEEMLQDLTKMLPTNLDVEAEDKWTWNFNGKNDFSVAGLRKYIDHHILPISVNMKTMWNRSIPKKINIFIWRLRRDCLPTSINLFAKGVDITSVTCPNRSNGAEYTHHVFHQCKLANETRLLIRQWTKCDIPNEPPERIIKWCEESNITAVTRHKLQAILFIWWWHIWKARNNALYNDSHESSLDVFNAIMSTSFIWIHNRNRKDHSSWDSWMLKPV